ncbi:MAG: cache domain-containing protein [Gammaproteobacteria bacterium]|nr:cache domain-containing protein [Gammaproteobacteria bacterium]
MKITHLRYFVLALCLLPALLWAESREEAQALAQKAALYVEQNGLDAAREAFHDKNGEFIKGSLYVFVQQLDGTMLIHGVVPKLENTNHYNLRDPKGTYFVREMAKVVQGPTGTGWVDYMWKHPKTGKFTPKTTYVQKLKGMDTYVGCGVFL